MYVVFLHNQGRNQTVRRDEANIRRAEGENLYGIGEGGSRMLFLSYLYGYFLKVVAFFITYRSTLFVLGCYTAQLVSGVVEEYSQLWRYTTPSPFWPIFPLRLLNNLVYCVPAVNTD